MIALHRLSATSSSGYLQILLFFIACVQLILQSDVPWLSMLSLANFSWQSGSVCFAPLSPFGKLALQVSIPFVACAELFVTMAAHAAWLQIRRAPGRNSIDRVAVIDRYVRGFLAVGLFSSSALSSAVLGSLQCVDVFSKGQRLWLNPTVDCSAAEYASWRAFAITLLIFPICTIPLLVFIGLLLANRAGRLTASEFVSRWGLLTDGYSPQWYFWEAVAQLRRLLLSGFSVALSSSPITRLLVLGMIVTVSLVLHMAALPFRARRSNWLEALSLFALFLISICHAVSQLNSSASVASAVRTLLVVLVLTILVVHVLADACSTVMANCRALAAFRRLSAARPDSISVDLGVKHRHLSESLLADTESL